jgi:hypothetical protein
LPSASLEITPARRQDLAEIARQMEVAFGADLPAQFLRQSFLEWKFFVPRSDWDGPRSYVVRHGERIVSHACVWPTVFEYSGGCVGASHLIDWLADPSAPGAGIAVYQHLRRLTGVLLAIGGSPQARRLLPKIGFAPYGTLETYARVIRPWNQFACRPRGALWRELARLGRNTAWSLGKLPKPDGGWSVQPATRAYEFPPAPPRTYGIGRRSADHINYLLGCPAAACRYYVLVKSGVPRGYFVLNPVGGQCRIVDVRVHSEERCDWQSAYRCAARAAAELASTCEVTVASALPWVAEILRRDGFRQRGEKPVVLYDPAGRLRGAPPLHLQMVDSDAFFLYSPSYPFVT